MTDTLRNDTDPFAPPSPEARVDTPDPVIEVAPQPALAPTPERGRRIGGRTIGALVAGGLVVLGAGLVALRGGGDSEDSATSTSTELSTPGTEAVPTLEVVDPELAALIGEMSPIFVDQKTAVLDPDHSLEPSSLDSLVSGIEFYLNDGLGEGNSKSVEALYFVGAIDDPEREQRATHLTGLEGAYNPDNGGSFSIDLSTVESATIVDGMLHLVVNGSYVAVRIGDGQASEYSGPIEFNLVLSEIDTRIERTDTIERKVIFQLVDWQG